MNKPDQHQLVPKNIIERIKKGEKQAFELVFREYYKPLWNLALGLLKSEELAEEYTQEVFIKLWEMRASLKDDLKLLPYLLTTVRNKCFNHLKRIQVEQKYLNHTQKSYQDQILNYTYNDVEDELIDKMYDVINEMPDKCKQVFQLSRFQNMSHKQIADHLDISTKTVENHITKAMKLLRESLLEILIFFILLIGDF